MPTIHFDQIDPIQYLVNKKYPWGYNTQQVINAKKASGRYSKSSIDENIRSMQPIEDYKKELIELKNKNPEEFELLLEKEKSKDQEEARLKFEKEEQERFYNQPWANADMGYWGKLDHWSLDECIALSFGKNPKYVNWKKIEPLLPNNVFAQKYEQLREICLRARDARILNDKMHPQTFVQWLKQKNISFPDQLEKLVLESRGEITDWHKKYQILEAAYIKDKVAFEQTIQQLQEDLTNSKNSFKELQNQLVPSVNGGKNSNKGPMQRKINNLLTLLYCIAEKNFRHKPGNENITAPLLENILTAKVENMVTKQTIKNYLEEGLIISGYLQEGWDLVKDNKK